MIYIDCWTERLDWSQYDLSKDEVYVVDNLFLGWFIHYVHETIMNSYGWFYGHTSGYPEDGARDIGADPDWLEAGSFETINISTKISSRQ